jgi:hypothetical protein
VSSSIGVLHASRDAERSRSSVATIIAADGGKAGWTRRRRRSVCVRKRRFGARDSKRSSAHADAHDLDARGECTTEQLTGSCEVIGVATLRNARASRPRRTSARRVSRSTTHITRRVHLTPANHAMHAANAPSCCRRAILQMFVASGPRRVRILN